MALTYSKQKQIAERYAQAGFELAKAQGNAQTVTQGLLDLKAAYEANTMLRSAVQSPMTPAADIAAVFEALVSRLKAEPLTARIAALLAKNGRAALLPAVAEAFSRKNDAEKGMRRVEVISAAPLDAAAKARIQTALGGDKRVVLEYREDASLIGGLVLRSGSQRLDASIAGKLERLQQRLTHSPIETV